MILLIDNYDSFTYNLYQAIGVMNSDVQVYRNDEITLEEIEKLNPQAIMFTQKSNFTVNRQTFSSTTKTRFSQV